MSAEARGSGPLTGVRIVEFAGIGPAPFGAMLLADLGADIIRLDRPGGYPPPAPSLAFEDMGPRATFNRGRRTLRLDIKAPQGRDVALRLVAGADALIEGYRPGTMERLGLGPECCLAHNSRLVYVRMTGWGQEGPMAAMAGHDLNYIGVSGALSLFARDSAPPPAIPPLVGDMGGGGLFMAFGLLAGVISARATGQGQVVDAAIVDGSSTLSTLLGALQKAGAHGEPAGRNMLDGGRYYYRTYPCADGGFVAVGAIEPAFRKALLSGLGLVDDPPFCERFRRKRRAAHHARGRELRKAAPEPLGGAVPRHRRMRHPGPVHGGGGASPPIGRARELRVGGRRRPARPRAPLPRHPGSCGGDARRSEPK